MTEVNQLTNAQVKKHLIAVLREKTGRNFKKQYAYDPVQLLGFANTLLDLNIPREYYPIGRVAYAGMRAIIDGRDRDSIIEALIQKRIEEMSKKQEARMSTHGSIMAYPEHAITIGSLRSSKFYSSPEWRTLRYKVLSERGNTCECCGRSPNVGVTIHVDHIKPRSIYPEYALDKNNLQILCEDCNIGKSNKHVDDWRKEL